MYDGKILIEMAAEVNLGFLNYKKARHDVRDSFLDVLRHHT